MRASSWETQPKLRDEKNDVDFRIIMLNHDAVPAGYAPQYRKNEYYIFANVSAGTAQVVFGKHSKTSGPIPAD